MSLLIVRCPLKPFNGSLNSSPADWQDLSHADSFEWCLVEGLEDDRGGIYEVVQSGIGTTESMPYADEALVLMPTFDVRLIEAKVPLVNSKKLQQILPNLIEEFLLSSSDAISVQALPPIPGKSAIQRTLAVIDRAWFNWLVKQLESLLSQRVRLVPDCLMLNLDGESSNPSLVFTAYEDNLVFSKRTGEQEGVAWVEKVSKERALELPQAVAMQQAVEISWEWLVPSVINFLQENANSRAPNFALNLLPNEFRRDVVKSKITRFTSIFAGQRGQGNAAETGITDRLHWNDPIVWREPKRWLQYLFGIVLIGSLLQLSWIAFNNWRWQNKMELVAVQFLTSNSVKDLAQNKVNTTENTPEFPTTVIGSFIKQVTQDQRRQGLVTDADFGPMAAKLTQLKLKFDPEVLQQLEYDGYGINFEFKADAVKLSPEKIQEAGRALGLLIKPLGANRFRLEPYAGLGLGS